MDRMVTKLRKTLVFHMIFVRNMLLPVYNYIPLNYSLRVGQ